MSSRKSWTSVWSDLVFMPAVLKGGCPGLIRVRTRLFVRGAQTAYALGPRTAVQIRTCPQLAAGLKWGYAITMRNWANLLERLWTQWRRTPVVSERRPVAVQVERSTPPVPAEYLSLYTYLEHRYASVVVLTFEQMESLLGFALPASASTERTWWSDDAVQTQRHAAAWVSAGRVATPNLPARTVTFERSGI
jgi:hypothetical protein